MAPWEPPEYRLDYLKRELVETGLRSDPCGLLDAVVKELAYALAPPHHEGHQFSYGAIVVNDWESQKHNIPDAYSGHVFRCPPSARSAADGITSFYVSDKSGQAKLWISGAIPISDEASLFSLRDEILFKEPDRSPHSPAESPDLVLVQRAKDGAVTLLGWDGIISIRDGVWTFRNYQYRVQLERKLEEREGPLSIDMRQTLRSALRIAVHVLSPLRYGATIIASFDGDEVLESVIGRTNAVEDLPSLTLRRKSLHGSIAHLLAQIDGAALVTEQGELTAVGLWLTPDTASVRTTQSVGGSRQLTAQVASTKIRSPIITVSSDGPVRAFHRGEIIAENFGRVPQRGVGIRGHRWFLV